MAAGRTGDRNEPGTTDVLGRAGSAVVWPGRVGGFATHRTCGLWLRAPGRDRAGGFFSMPHEACGTTTRYTTRVAVIGVQIHFSISNYHQYSS